MEPEKDDDMVLNCYSSDLKTAYTSLVRKQLVRLRGPLESNGEGEPKRDECWQPGAAGQDPEDTAGASQKVQDLKREPTTPRNDGTEPTNPQHSDEGRQHEPLTPKTPPEQTAGASSQVHWSSSGPLNPRRDRPEQASSKRTAAPSQSSTNKTQRPSNPPASSSKPEALMTPNNPLEPGSQVSPVSNTKTIDSSKPRKPHRRSTHVMQPHGVPPYGPFPPSFMPPQGSMLDPVQGDGKHAPTGRQRSRSVGQRSPPAGLFANYPQQYVPHPGDPSGMQPEGSYDPMYYSNFASYPPLHPLAGTMPPTPHHIKHQPGLPSTPSPPGNQLRVETPTKRSVSNTPNKGSFKKSLLPSRASPGYPTYPYTYPLTPQNTSGILGQYPPPAGVSGASPFFAVPVHALASGPSTPAHKQAPPQHLAHPLNMTPRDNSRFATPGRSPPKVTLARARARHSPQKPAPPTRGAAGDLQPQAKPEKPSHGAPGALVSKGNKGAIDAMVRTFLEHTEPHRAAYIKALVADELTERVRRCVPELQAEQVLLQKLVARHLSGVDEVINSKRISLMVQLHIASQVKHIVSNILAAAQSAPALSTPPLLPKDATTQHNTPVSQQQQQQHHQKSRHKQQQREPNAGRQKHRGAAPEAAGGRPSKAARDGRQQQAPPRRPRDGESQSPRPPPLWGHGGERSAGRVRSGSAPQPPLAHQRAAQAEQQQPPQRRSRSGGGGGGGSVRAGVRRSVAAIFDELLKKSYERSTASSRAISRGRPHPSDSGAGRPPWSPAGAEGRGKLLQRRWSALQSFHSAVQNVVDDCDRIGHHLLAHRSSVRDDSANAINDDAGHPVHASVSPSHPHPAPYLLNPHHASHHVAPHYYSPHSQTRIISEVGNDTTRDEDDLHPDVKGKRPPFEYPHHHHHHHQQQQHHPQQQQHHHAHHPAFPGQHSTVPRQLIPPGMFRPSYHDTTRDFHSDEDDESDDDRLDRFHHPFLTPESSPSVENTPHAPAPYPWTPFGPYYGPPSGYPTSYYMYPDPTSYV